ncbi:Transposon Tf2-9 polyprotein [Phytophthora citrophthora]|uniref:Transposon Tf2-9 polyprotein n=1 Tax=Phytophthora citrophthora TaxID=4793 RepID=A0AAD9LB99_9STRA|nr:Transposon Tf2-9 polyprotein [Phytophthora citrophthora]
MTDTDFNTVMPVTSSALMPPYLTDVSHQALVKWKRERQEYEDAVEAHCATTGEDRTKALISVKYSLNRQLLETLCKFEWNTTIEDVTEARIVAELDKIVSNVMNDAIIDVDSIFKTELKMDMRERDVKARVIKYFMKCDEVIMQHGLAGTFSTIAGIKEKCKILKRHLEPAALRDAIDTHHRLVDPSSKTDETKLYSLVKEKALEQEKVFHLLSKRNRQQPRRTDDGTRTMRNSEKPPKPSNNQGFAAERHNEAKSNRLVVKSSATKKSQPSAESKPRTGCFHCGKDHWLSQCPDLDEVAKEALLAERKSKKGANGNGPKRYRTKRLEQSTVPVSDGRTTFLLNDTVEVPCCADSGCDLNIISRKHVELLQAQDSTVELIELDEPVHSQAVGGTTLISTHAIDVRLTINTAAGPVRCQDPKRCLIIESDENEMLVGKLLLVELGIDIEQQLEYLACRGPDDDDSFDGPDGMPPCKPNKVEVVQNVVDALVHDAIDRGVIDDYITTRLYEVLHKHSGWRLELGDDPPARVPPLKIRLKQNATPYRCKVRQYSPDKSAFLEAFNKRLVELGWVFENRESRWCCPALPVRKPSTNEFRQTTDYRPINGMTEPIAGVMPSLEIALEHCKGMMYYAMFDFLKGFWQLPLHRSSQELLSYMTDKGVFTPTRVPQGSSDAALHFQSTVEMVLGNLVNKCVIVWIDDLLVFANSQEELVDATEAVLKKLDEHGLILNPKKSAVFLTEVRWCGRIINKHGIGHDPERIRALREIPTPATAAELQQFLCASTWMRAGLVDYARVARPLQERLDAALAGTRKTKRAAAGIRIELTTEEEQAFEAVKELLSNSATLAYPDPDKQLCLLSDASDRGWGLVVSQVRQWKPDVPIQEQDHELLICMDGNFSGSALNWSVIEKESHPIVHACERLEYLLLRPQGFRLYCDHRNIIFLFSPSKELKKHVRGKLLRWSTKLLEYRYTIEHIAGVHNVWADLISRWGGKQQPAARIHSAKRFTRSKRKHAESVAMTKNDMTPLRPLDQNGFVWPTTDEIGSIQALHVTPKGAVPGNDDLWRVNGLIWIPSDATELIERLLIIAHCGHNGHRGMNVMTNHIRRLFSIGGLSRMVCDFCEKCLLCLHVKGGVVIPRPFSETHHTYERNHTLHWDFLTLGESFGTSRYVLVLKDEATHFAELVECDGPTSEVAATSILDWYSRFGPPSVWVSDSGSHFKSKVISELGRRLKSRLEFILAYTPWKNGSVERVNRDITQVLKALALEFKVSMHDWPYLLPLVQSSINHSPVASLATTC